MNSFVGNFCDNCQMSFETKDLLSLHSCANIKEKISELDATISDDPLSIHGSQNDIKIKEEIDPLSKVSEMINEGNVELTKAIDMVHQYNLKVHEGKNLDIKRELVIKTENVHEEENSNPISKKKLLNLKKLKLILFLYVKWWNKEKSLKEKNLLFEINGYLPRM